MFSLLLRDAHLQHGAWRAAWSYAWPSREGEHGKPSFQPTCVNFGRLQNFFLIFTSLSLLFSCNCAGFVWFSVHTLFYISFFFLCGSFHFFFFFLILSFGSPFSPYFCVKPIACVCLFSFFLFSFLFPFSFPFSQLSPFHSIGTREVVTQKNLSGLVPMRDLRLDPSLLCSLPLLALSPNLLIVWLFLSIAYLLTKLRCK